MDNPVLKNTYTLNIGVCMKYIKNTKYMVDCFGNIHSPFGKKMTQWKENNTGYWLVRIRVKIIHCVYVFKCQTTNRDECSGVGYKLMVLQMIGHFS